MSNFITPVIPQHIIMVPLAKISLKDVFLCCQGTVVVWDEEFFLMFVHSPK